MINGLEGEEGFLPEGKFPRKIISCPSPSLGAEKLFRTPRPDDRMKKNTNGAIRPRSVDVSQRKPKATNVSRPRSHRSAEDSSDPRGFSIVFSHVTLPEGTAPPNPAVKMFVFGKKEGGKEARGHRRTAFPQHPVPSSSTNDTSDGPTTPIQTWSPTPTERPTPPYELPAAGLQRSQHRSSPDAAGPNCPIAGASSTKISRVLSFFGRRARSVPVAPAGSTGHAATRTVEVAATATAIDNDEAREAPFPTDPPIPPSSTSVEGLVPPRPAAAAAAASAGVVSPGPAQQRQLRLSMPMVSGTSTSGSMYTDVDDPLGSSRSAQRLATKRAEPEADVEEGRFPALTLAGAEGTGDAGTAGRAPIVAPAEAAADAEAAAQAMAAAVVAPAKTSDVAEPAVIENGIVMPCPPSEREKVLYHTTGRGFLMTAGTLCFLVTTAGMWLFTIASPYFFWFGAPAVFLMLYLVLHYFVVGVWGKDFVPEVHEEVVRAAAVAGYLPTVDVFLPVCGEDIALLRNTWRNVAAMDYPSFEVHVLDDGAKDAVRDLAETFGFRYIRRDNRPDMKKAGNLRYAFARTSGDALVIFDADFCPRTDFLKETTPYLSDPTIGILQTPQYFRLRKEQTWVEQGAAASQEFFYRMVQTNQDRFSGSVCVGSCGLYRRSAVEPFGGVVPISHSEDMYTGFKMTELGYKIKYLPLCLAMGTCPDEPRSFFMQQYRWCMGSATLVTEKGFWAANLSPLHKICFVNGLLYYIATALFLFLAPTPIMLLIYLKADSVLWYYSGFAVPSILMVTVAMPMWSKQHYGMSVHRVRVIQCYAHLYALKDRLLGTAAAWIPSGGGASRSSSKAYRSSVVLMVAWSTFTTIAIVGGSIWRMLEFPWYHYVPSIALATGSFFLSISSLYP